MFRRLKAALKLDKTQEIKPVTTVETAGNKKDLFSEQTRTQKQLKQYITIYEQGGLIAEGIDLYPLMMLSKGWKFEGEQVAIDKCTEFIEAFDFSDCLYQAIVHSLVCGDAFQEIAPNRAGEVVTLLPRNSSQFNIAWDQYGLITGFIQQIGDEMTGTKVQLDPAQICHVQLMPSISGLYGLSLIQRAYDEAIRDVRLAEGISDAIVRHGTPKWHAKVGSPGEAVPDGIISTIARKLENLRSKNEIVTTQDVSISSLDTAGIPGVDAYATFSTTRLITALGVPGELLGLRQGTTDATAVSRITSFLQKCSTLQHRLARQFSLQVLDQVTGIPGSAKLVFNSIIPDNEMERINMVVTLMKANPLDPFWVGEDWIVEKTGISLDKQPKTEQQ